VILVVDVVTDGLVRAACFDELEVVQGVVKLEGVAYLDELELVLVVQGVDGCVGVRRLDGCH
jgi:hypothetical protein